MFLQFIVLVHSKGLKVDGTEEQQLVSTHHLTHSPIDDLFILCCITFSTSV